VRSINRRELNQRSGQIIDEVLATGEPVEVVTRGVGSVVISRREESLYEEWVRIGLVRPATGFLADAPKASSPRSVEEILEDISSDR
jgi:prevent-host-death family protein